MVPSALPIPPSPPQDGTITSGRLNSRRIGGWHPGMRLADGRTAQTIHVEARVQAPEAGEGLWPAVWLTPLDGSKYGAWPASGEVRVGGVCCVRRRAATWGCHARTWPALWRCTAGAPLAQQPTISTAPPPQIDVMFSRGDMESATQAIHYGQPCESRGARGQQPAACTRPAAALRCAASPFLAMTPPSFSTRFPTGPANSMNESRTWRPDGKPLYAAATTYAVDWSAEEISSERF